MPARTIGDKLVHILIDLLCHNVRPTLLVCRAGEKGHEDILSHSSERLERILSDFALNHDPRDVLGLQLGRGVLDEINGFLVLKAARWLVRLQREYAQSQATTPMSSDARTLTATRSFPST